MAAILNVQYGGHAGVCANANIDFWIRHVLNITKMYSFANLHKFSNTTMFFDIVNLTTTHSYSISNVLYKHAVAYYLI